MLIEIRLIFFIKRKEKKKKKKKKKRIKIINHLWGNYLNFVIIVNLLKVTVPLSDFIIIIEKKIFLIINKSSKIVKIKQNF